MNRRTPLGASAVLGIVGVAAVTITLGVSAALGERDRRVAGAQLTGWATVTTSMLQRRLDAETERLEGLRPARGESPDPGEEGWWAAVDRVADRATAGRWRAVLMVRPGAGDGWYRTDVPGAGPSTAPAAVVRLVVWDSTPLLAERLLPAELAAALARSRDTGTATLSAAVRTGPDGPAPAAGSGTALVLPVYDPLLPDDADVAARRRHLAGWLVADVVLSQLFADGLSDPPGGRPAVLRDAAGRHLAGDDGARDADPVRVSLDVDLAGSAATLEVSRADAGPRLAPAPLVSGLAVIAMLWFLGLLRGRAEARARRLVRERTAALRARTRDLELVTDGSPDVMLRLGPDGTVLFANPAARHVVGLPEDPVGMQLAAGADRELSSRLLESVAAVQAEGSGRVLDLSAATGQGPREFEVSVVPVVESAGSGGPRPADSGAGPPEVLVVGRDVTERRKVEHLLAHRALHDPLTGLANRALVEERLAAALAPRDGGAVAVVMLDLDRFKLVNDSLGHAVGDDLLVQIGHRLRHGAARRTDAVGRLGGDEFVVVATLDHAGQAMTVARELLGAFEAPFRLGGTDFTFTASLGVAVAEADTCTAPELISRADAAMYRAKAAGGNGIAVYEPDLADASLGRLLRAEQLRGAVASGELFLDYQPEIDLRDEVGVSDLEALVRWRHPRHGVLGPGEFVPLAEETGLIVQLGAWVLDRAVAQVAAHNRRTGGDVRVWVNVSARQLALTDVEELVSATLAAHAAPGRWLGVEVTESAFLAEDDRVEQALQGVRAGGVAVAVDDFGTGWSSLSRLQGFPVDALKVDRAFVHALAGPGGARAEHIVAAIVAMGRALSATVVAEGIETARELELLRLLGCDLGQGYHLSRPTTWHRAVTTGAGGRAEGLPS